MFRKPSHSQPARGPRPFRPRVEELERRDAPAAHLIGCHALNETVHAQLNGPAAAQGTIPGGLLHGQVSLNDTVVFSDGISTTISGTLTIATNQGTVRVRNTGRILALTQTFTDAGTITGGTGRFRGATGTLSIQGTLDAASKAVDATLTGMICGPAAHRGPGGGSPPLREAPLHHLPSERRHRPRPLPASVRRHILVNGVPLSAVGAAILRQLGIRPLPGAYWYDPISGAVGALGQGASGFLPPGLPLGGPLAAGASNGTSGVFVNGRELTTGEVAFLETVLGSSILPGFYFLNANGDAGTVGGPVVANLVALARQRGIGHVSPLSTFDLTGISVLGDGSFIGILNSDGPSVTFA